MTDPVQEFTEDDLRRLDADYAARGVAFHARPLRAAMDILSGGFQLGVGADGRVERIATAYRSLFPDSQASWPGMGIGFAAVNDRVRRVTVPVVYGTMRVDLAKVLGFESHQQFEAWCARDRRTAALAYYAAADLLDMTYGLDDLRGEDSVSEGFWQLAFSNLEDVTSSLAGNFSVSSTIQSIGLVAELSMKAALLKAGVAEGELRSRQLGHNHAALADRLAAERPHRDDALVRRFTAAMPDYVNSRYADTGLNRLQLVERGLGSQFIVASSLRRFSTRDMAQHLEADTWPGPRDTYLTL